MSEVEKDGQQQQGPHQGEWAKECEDESYVIEVDPQQIPKQAEGTTKVKQHRWGAKSDVKANRNWMRWS